MIDTYPHLRGDIEFAHYRHGRLCGRFCEQNLIVANARDALARLLGGAGSAKVISKIGFGIGRTPAADADVHLTGAFVKAIATATYPQPGAVRFSWTLEEGEANGLVIAEMGLICADGSLFSRKVRAGLLEKTADDRLDGEWTIRF